MSLAERYRRCAICLSLACAVLLTFAVAATAATYPAGGSTFEVGAEGWQASDANCSIPLGTCSASGSHDPDAGNPPGALSAQTSVGLNIGGLFSSNVRFESPNFLVAESGSAAIRLDRQFSPAGLLALAPEAEYTVSLIDRRTGTSTDVITESLGEADGAFAGRSGAAIVLGGHSYAIAIQTGVGSRAIGLGVLGESAVRFDNVALATTAAGAGGGAGSGRAGGGGAGPVVRRHVFVKVRCPRRPRRACWITAHGRIGKRIRATYRRTVRVAKGRSRVIALRIRPRLRQRVLRRKRIVVVQRTRIGRRTTTFARSRALIRRR